MLSGIYTIDPDGAGGIEPFDVQCDMTADGGGWTLAFLKSSVDRDTYSDALSTYEDIEHLVTHPADASTATSAYGGWINLNEFLYIELKMAAYWQGIESYRSNIIRRADLRIPFGQNGYYLYNDSNGYYWCGGVAAYTDSGVGQANQPLGAPADCKSHSSLGSGWDFSESQGVNTGLTLCGSDASNWMFGSWGASLISYPNPGAAHAIWAR